MKRRKKTSRGDQKKTEPIVAGIVITAVLLCMVVSFLGYLESRWEQESIPANAVVANAEPEDVSQEDPFANYTQLDDPLLVLVNDQVPLPEDWTVTPRMIDDEQVDIRMYEDLTAMIDAAEKEEVWCWIASGYRSVEQQEIILSRAVEENMEKGMTKEKGEKEALRTIARPGYSEHHTGLAVDLNDVSDDFESTPAYRWFSQHSAEYGFVQRYKKEKVEWTGIDNESWHFRYVGRENALEMEKLDMCLEEYVIYRKKKEKP